MHLSPTTFLDTDAFNNDKPPPTLASTLSLIVHLAGSVSHRVTIYKNALLTRSFGFDSKGVGETHVFGLATEKSSLLHTMGTQSPISKLKLAGGNKGSITVTPHPFHLPFGRNTSQFHLERLSHKIWAPSSPRTTGQ